MKKLVCLTLAFVIAIGLFAMPACAYEPQYVGTVYASNSVCYINNYPINCYIMNDYMFIQVEDLNNYGFDVKWNAYNETLRILKDDNKAFIPQTVYRPYNEQIGDRRFDMKTTNVRTYIGNYGYEIECLAGLSGCTYINVDNLSVFGKMEWNNEDEAMYITTSNPDFFLDAWPVKKDPDYVPWYDCGDENELEGHKHYYDFSHYISSNDIGFWYGAYSEYANELSACSFCYGNFYVDIYDTEGRKVYYTSDYFGYYDWDYNWKYIVPYYRGETDAPVGYEVKVPMSKLKKGKDYMAHVSFWCSWCNQGYEEKIYFTTPYSYAYLPGTLNL